MPDNLTSTLVGFTLGLASSYLTMWLTKSREAKESEYWLMMEIYWDLQVLADLHDQGIKGEGFKALMGGRHEAEVHMDLQRKLFRLRRRKNMVAAGHILRFLHMRKHFGGDFGVKEARPVLQAVRRVINPKLFDTLLEWDPRKIPQKSYDLLGVDREKLIALWDEAEARRRGE